jgi:hypothetical protein
VIVVLAVFGAIGAMLLQRYVIVVATAFGGAWTLLLGALALSDRAAGRASRLGDVWILYPNAPAPVASWLPIAWIVLGIVGTGVQLGLTGRKK